MGMSFWDSIRGNRLADTLIQYLPKLVVESKSQYSVMCHGHEFGDVVDGELKKGNRYINHFANEDWVTIIFENS